MTAWFVGMFFLAVVMMLAAILEDWFGDRSLGWDRADKPSSYAARMQATYTVEDDNGEP